MNPADLTLATFSPSLTSKALPLQQSASVRNGRIPIARVELEPIYTQLKAALGDHWADYKAAVNAFVLGHLNQAELSWVLQPLLTAAPSLISSADATKLPVSPAHLHNTLVAAIYANTLREPPPTDVAPWVVATDKPTTASKNPGATGASDQAEERVKRETMALHARDRKRIKALKESGTAVNNGIAEAHDYRHELAVKPPEIPPQSGGGFTKTNWDLEIRRRYAQPLAAETLEFPTQSDVQNRIEPICYEEGLQAGAQSTLQLSAELVEQAAEVYLKEMLGHLCSHARSNVVDGIQTSAFKRRLRKEEYDVERGALQRNASGLLPVETEAQARRDPLNMEDLRVSLGLADPYLRQDRFLNEDIMLNRWPTFDLDAPMVNGVAHHWPAVNGDSAKSEHAAEEDSAIDGVDFWKGSTSHERDDLMGVLDECLAAV